MFKASAFNFLRALESSIFDGNFLPFFLGNVHVYRNGRMHFAHHNRQERREQQRDVREIICSGFLQFLHQLMWFHPFFFFCSKQGGLALFFQLMPILILIIVSALSQLMVTQPPYSLSYHPWVFFQSWVKIDGHVCSLMVFVLMHRSTGHIHKRHTSHLKVPFYVGDRFNEEFSGNNLKNVERNVEEDYISNLRNNCWKEKQQSEFKEHEICLVCHSLDGSCTLNSWLRTPILYFQRKVYCIVLVTLGTLICTRRHKEWPLRAVPDCLRFRLCWMVRNDVHLYRWDSTDTQFK